MWNAAPYGNRVGKLAGTAARGASSATAAATTAPCTHGVFRIDREPVLGHVDADGSGLLAQGTLYYEAVPKHVIGIVVLTRLVQSQRQPRAASTPGCHEHADRGLFLVRKVPIQLGLCGVTQFDHFCLLGALMEVR